MNQVKDMIFTSDSLPHTYSIKEAREIVKDTTEISSTYLVSGCTFIL